MTLSMPPVDIDEQYGKAKTSSFVEFLPLPLVTQLFIISMFLSKRIHGKYNTDMIVSLMIYPGDPGSLSENGNGT